MERAIRDHVALLPHVTGEERRELEALLVRRITATIRGAGWTFGPRERRRINALLKRAGLPALE